MKKLSSIKAFKADQKLSEETKVEIRGGLGGHTTSPESWPTNWPEEGGSDTENWVYSDSGSVISATVTNSQGGIRNLLR